MLRLTLIGGPTALIEFGGLRWLTDPTFSEPGEHGGLTKLTGPAIRADAVGPVDAVLISHDQHADNLDPAGREFLPRATQVLTTAAGAERLAAGNCGGLEPWQTVELGATQVTAVPALHGPPGAEPTSGPVIGFVLEAGGRKVYVSGDNASVPVVEQIAQKVGPVDVAILFAGAVQLPFRFDGAYLTLSSDRAAQAAEILEAPVVIPLHFEGWGHFTQGAEQLRASFAGYGLTPRLRLPERGVPLEV